MTMMFASAFADLSVEIVTNRDHCGCSRMELFDGGFEKNASLIRTMSDANGTNASSHCLKTKIRKPTLKIAWT